MCNSCGYIGRVGEMKVATPLKYRAPLSSNPSGVSVMYCPQCGVAYMGGLTNKD